MFIILLPSNYCSLIGCKTEITCIVPNFVQRSLNLATNYFVQAYVAIASLCRELKHKS